MSQVVSMTCPGCGARVEVSQKECEWCHAPLVITTMSDVFNMAPMDINKYSKEYETNLQENPNNAEINNSLGMCYLKLGFYDRALAKFDKAIEQDLNNPEITDQILDAIENADLDENQHEKLEAEFAKEIHLMIAEPRLKSIARDFVKHYSDLWTSGKSMFVCLNKVTCVRMYNYVQEYWKQEINILKKSLKTATQQEYLEENIEYIDNDLTDIQDELFEEVTFDDLNGLEDEYVEINCEKCSKPLFVEQQALNNNNAIPCPFCGGMARD